MISFTKEILKKDYFDRDKIVPPSLAVTQTKSVVPTYAKPDVNTKAKISQGYAKPSFVSDVVIKSATDFLKGVRKVGEFLAPENEEEAKKQGMTNIGTKENPIYMDVFGATTGMGNVGKKFVKKVAPKIIDVTKNTLKGVGKYDHLLSKPSSIGSPSEKSMTARNLPKPGLVTKVSPSKTQTEASSSRIPYTLPSNLYNLPGNDLSIYSDYSKVNKLSQVNKKPFISDIERATGLAPEIRIKEQDTFIDKIKRMEKQGINPKEMTDTLAGRITVKPEQLSTQLENIKKNFEVVNVRDWFKSPSQFQYRGINVSVKLPSGTLAEIQIHTPESLEISNKVHKYYKKWRNFSKDSLTPQQIKQLNNDVETSKRIAEDILSVGQKESQIERGFITSVKEVLPKAEKLAGQYIPRSTDELAIKAKNFIKDDPMAAEKLAMTAADESAVAVASELIKKYGDEALKATDSVQANMYYDKAAEIANTIAPKLTEAGRTVQAASILGRLTPEGQIRFAAKEISKYNETAIRKIPELTGEQAKFISEEMKTIQGMKDGIERAERFQKLQQYIKELVPTPLVKKVIAIWKAGLLTGLKTTGLNIFSNLSHSATEIAKDLPATIVDSVASLFTGQRAKTFSMKGYGGGLKEGFDRGLRYLKTGFDERNIAQKLDYKKVNFGKGPIGKAFQTYTDTVFRVMGATDQPFYYGALARSLGDQAMAQGLNKGLRGNALKEFSEKLVQNPTEEMLRYAVADASTAVFQNQTYLGKAAKALQNFPVVGEIVVPFGRTPSAVATQIVNYTPVGTAIEIIKQIRRGKFDQRLFSEAVGRGLTGTAALYIGWQMAKKGLISLDRPTNEREQKLWELEGRKPNSIKVGNKWRSPILLGPAGNLLLIGGHFNKAFKESGSPSEAMSKAVLGSGKSFAEQTFLTGINSATNALNDPGRYAESYLGGMVASIIPTISSDVARAIDPKERRSETISQRLKARIPGARQTLQPQIDVLGKERESVGNPLEILIDPTRPSKENASPVISELRRLTDVGYKVSPTLLGDKKGFDGLTQKENTQLWKRAGEIINGKLGSLFANELYKKLEDDEDRGKVVEDVVDKSKVVASAEMVLQLTDGLSGENLKNKLSELKKGKLMTKEVYNKYLELR